MRQFVSSMAGANADYICFDHRATMGRRDQIIAHELGHILMNHGENAGSRTDWPQMLAPMIDSALVERFLTRTGYEAEIEAATEEFGTRLVQTGRRRRGPVGIDALGRLTGSLR